MMVLQFIALCVFLNLAGWIFCIICRWPASAAEQLGTVIGKFSLHSAPVAIGVWAGDKSLLSALHPEYERITLPEFVVLTAITTGVFFTKEWCKQWSP